MTDDTAVDIEVRDLTMAFGANVVQRDLNFDIKRGDIFVIIGGSGCGKSTLLKHMLGLIEPARGEILYRGESFTRATNAERDVMRRRWGITYQSGGLFGAMTLAQNISLPLQLYTDYTAAEIRDVVDYKLSLVGLGGFEGYFPAEISGGMEKRAALARAIALDPDILFFDEPSAGLDPISSRLLDELIAQLKESIGATVVMVSHELASIFEIATNSVYLDADSHTMLDYGDPRMLRDHSEQPIVRQFLSRSTEHQEEPANE
ncbi:polyamine ABC transporter ATP-binding protein [Kineobactrum sediminis]|uniref:Polyamine ABC transporter ATP-binding protein n=1 Tax=Kineobactrum sediminis TaxID=1905677 RepID=A0A2N5Y3M3_9GAMM|nr:ATP-binding cassette domain-containing protein [Kineobactrum sediminis]PLW82993.1 polyamine ABC transporter ATP-binding protein [Kineobactrum sediminis]